MQVGVRGCLCITHDAAEYGDGAEDRLRIPKDGGLPVQYQVAEEP